MAEKTYVKVSVKPGKYGLKLSGKADEVIKQIQEHTNDKGYFNWDINPRKEVGKYGDTHTVTVNDWKPEAAKEQKDDLPF